MTEDELLAGLLDAMKLTGWRYWHARRSDHALWVGTQGWPDITALGPRLNGPLLVMECKSDLGRLTEEQARWIALLHRAGVTTAVVRPAGYDRALRLILAGDSSAPSWEAEAREQGRDLEANECTGHIKAGKLDVERLARAMTRVSQAGGVTVNWGGGPDSIAADIAAVYERLSE